MSKHDIVQPTVDQYGADTHPAFATIGASRGSYGGEGTVLFDSDVKHRQTVTITVHEATRRRQGGHDYVHGGSRRVVEVELSEAQWASFVSSMNVGNGVPCTLRGRDSNWDIPGLPYDPRLAHSMAEVKEGAERTFGPIQDAVAAYDALDSKATAKQKREALDAIRDAVRHASANLTYASKVLAGHAEDVVQKARADVEAMVVQKATQLGLTTGQAEGLLSLPVFEGEVVSELPAGDGDAAEES